MFKKLLIFVALFLSASLFSSFLFSQNSYAQVPTVTIDKIGPLEYKKFPQTYNVTGTVTLKPGVTLRLILTINEEKETAYGSSPADYLYYLESSSKRFSLPWSIKGPGTYEVKVRAKYSPIEIGVDMQTVKVTRKKETKPAPSIEEPSEEEAPAAETAPVTEEVPRTFTEVIRKTAKDVGTTVSEVVGGVVATVKEVGNSFIRTLEGLFSRFF